MNIDFIENKRNGFILSQIHASFQHLLNKQSYKNLLQSDSIDDILIKLSATGYKEYLKEEKIVEKKELKKSLEKGLKKEFQKIYEKSNGELKILMKYFLESYMIDSFIYRISNPKNCDEEELGFFLELNALNFAKSFKEIKLLIIKDSFLEKYFKNIEVNDDISKNNLQIIKRKLLKYHMEEFYEMLNKMESLDYMKNILKIMGSLQIIEIVLNSIHTSISSENKKELFPIVNNLSPSIINSLSNCQSIDDLKSIISKTGYSNLLNYSDILNGMHFYLLNVFYNSFKTFNDLSCVFCYFKLKEQEIRNLGWLVDFLGEDENEVMENIYTLDK